MNDDNLANGVALDEERKQSSHEDIKSSIDAGVNARIKQESSKSDPAQNAEVASVAKEMQQRSVRETISTEHEVGRGKVAARMSQFVDYLFYLVYGLIVLEFMLKIMGARPGNGFVQFVAAITHPILGPFERIVGTPSAGSIQIQLSYLIALVVYILIHLAINGIFRLVAHRKVTV